MKDSAIGAVILIVALFLFCGFLGNIGIFDAIDGRERRTEELHDIQMTEERAQAKARATREALAINQELHNAALNQERQRLELEREKKELEQANQSTDLYMGSAAYVRAGASVAWALGIATLALGLPITAIVWLWNRRKPIGIGSAAEGLGRIFVDVERARAYGIANKAPKTLSITDNHALSLANHNRQDIQGLEASAAAPVNVPTFRQLLDAGTVGAGQPMLLGFTADGPLQGSWNDLYSAAIAGATGSGKTTTTRFIASQGALQGAEFAIIDPHAGAGDESLAGTLAPLYHSFKWQPATTNDEILDLVTLIENEIDRRARYGGAEAPLIVAVDELTALLKKPSLEKSLAIMLERIAQEGRKLRIYAMLCGQIWSASRSGGSELRDSLASAYVHRIKRAQARFLLPPEEAADAERLATGAALFYRTSGEIEALTIPNTTARDVVEVGQITAKHTTSRSLHDHFTTTSSDTGRSDVEVPLKYFRSDVEVPLKWEASEGNTAKSTESLSDAKERAEVMRYIEEGASMTATIRAVWGVTGGPAFRDAADRYKSIIATL